MSQSISPLTPTPSSKCTMETYPRNDDLSLPQQETIQNTFAELQKLEYKADLKYKKSTQKEGSLYSYFGM